MEILASAYDDGRMNSSHQLTWYEEWQLTKVDDEQPGGVQLIAVTEARDLRQSIAECVYAIVEKGQRKFLGKRWADIHVLVLERSSAMIVGRIVEELIDNLEPQEVDDIDMILFVDDASVAQLYPRTTRKEPS